MAAQLKGRARADSGSGSAVWSPLQNPTQELPCTSCAFTAYSGTCTGTIWKECHQARDITEPYRPALKQIRRSRKAQRLVGLATADSDISASAAAAIAECATKSCRRQLQPSLLSSTDYEIQRSANRNAQARSPPAAEVSLGTNGVILEVRGRSEVPEMGHDRSLHF